MTRDQPPLFIMCVLEKWHHVRFYHPLAVLYMDILVTPSCIVGKLARNNVKKFANVRVTAHVCLYMYLYVLQLHKPTLEVRVQVGYRQNQIFYLGNSPKHNTSHSGYPCLLHTTYCNLLQCNHAFSVTYCIAIHCAVSCRKVV